MNSTSPRTGLRLAAAALTVAAVAASAPAASASAGQAATATASADQAASACAPSATYHLQAQNIYGDWERAAEVDTSINACAFTPANEWRFDVVQAAPNRGYGLAGWKVRAWFQNQDQTPDYRTVVLKIRVDHCYASGKCANDLAAFDVKYRLFRDGYTRQVITDTSTEVIGDPRGWRIDPRS
ncbi:hypothetical protein ACFVVX_20285 [Kitasatospora sp. NPDC058170]|uniref:hypothetical protein n=1 Tax=Kitasatospora sp. NPDC058170 TaxID=3346364 RepID=UPI0036DF1630